MLRPNQDETARKWRSYIARCLLFFLSISFFSAHHSIAGEAANIAQTEPPTFSWAGMYLGINSGAGVPLHTSEHLHPNGGRDISTVDLYPTSGVRTGVTFGAQVGYNWQKDHFVYGFETDFNYLTGQDGKSGFFQTPAFYYPRGVTGYWLNYQRAENFYGSMRARLGLAFDRLLIYGTGGVALGGTRGPATLAFLADEKEQTFPVAPKYGFAALQSFSRRMKYIIGAGAEYAFLDDTSLRFETFYLNRQLNNQDFNVGSRGQYLSSFRNENFIFRAGINHQFGDENDAGGSIEENTDNKEKEKVKEELYSFHGLTTTSVQGYPEFYAKYSGTNSFKPQGQVRSGTTAGLFIGIRLWEGASAYFNPEMDQGYGLQNTVGAASYVNASTTRVGSSAPYMRAQRLFLRQNIGLGGGKQEDFSETGAQSELLESTANQVSGKVDKDRLTFTIGKMSVQDIFDDNEYAHDPTKDFMNFAFTTLGTFDYAANKWGYTDGAVLEWRQNWWTTRAGVYQLSQLPGSVNIEPVIFRQYMAVGEVEGRYQILGQPGVLKFLYFCNNGYFNKFDDIVALSYAKESFPPSITNNSLRQWRQKDGVGVNISQQIMPNIGFFLRGGFNNGRYETIDYTDMNKTMTAGLVFFGSIWGRPDDKIGVAGAVSGISGSFVRYLSLGGIGSFVGDGRLSYTHEKNLETFYKWHINEWLEATADYQFFANPGYNLARGPVNFFGLRLRAEF